MNNEKSLNLLGFLLSFSDALDLSCPALTQHQTRVAFIVSRLSKELGLSPESSEKVFFAALLHDIGAVTDEEKIDIHQFDCVNTSKHCRLGEMFFRQIDFLAPSAEIVKYHHRDWEEWEQDWDAPVVQLSQIVHLADKLEILINRNKNILLQEEEITEQLKQGSRTTFAPQLVEAMRAVVAPDTFWYDLTSTRIQGLLLQDGPFDEVVVDLPRLAVISEMFRSLIDMRSPYTATHSVGVATAAACLSELCGMPKNEVGYMQIAGNLHDLGKLVVPNQILDKPDKLTNEEFAVVKQHPYYTNNILSNVEGIDQITRWAANHHEKLDGSGYPNHYDRTRLDLGSRIMAVADVFNALFENRPYRDGLKKAEVANIMDKQVKNHALDGEIVQVLKDNYQQVAETTVNKQLEIGSRLESMIHTQEF